MNAEFFSNEEVILIDGNLINDLKQDIQKRYDSGLKTIIMTSDIDKSNKQTRFARGFSGGLVIPQLNKSVE